MVQSRRCLPLLLVHRQSSFVAIPMVQQPCHSFVERARSGNHVIHTLIGKDELEVLGWSPFLGKEEEQLMEWWTDGFAFMACWKDCDLHRVHRGEGFACLEWEGKLLLMGTWIGLSSRTWILIMAPQQVRVPVE